MAWGTPRKLEGAPVVARMSCGYIPGGGMKSNAMEAGLAACHGDGAAYPVEGRIAARRGRIRSRTG